MLAGLARVALILAVLLAQQTAFTHQLSHVAAAQAADGQKAPKGDRLCDLHDLLGTVLGVAAGAACEPAFLALSEPGFIAPVIAAREAQVLATHSRDPPLVS